MRELNTSLLEFSFVYIDLTRIQCNDEEGIYRIGEAIQKVDTEIKKYEKYN